MDNVDLSDVSPSVTGPDVGEATVVGVPGAIVKDGSGVLLFPGEASLLLPTGESAGMLGYWMVGEASVASPEGTRGVRRMARQLPLDALSVGDWPALAELPSLDGDALRWVPAADAAAQHLEWLDSSGAVLQDTWLGPAVDSIELPELAGLGAARLHGLVGPAGEDGTSLDLTSLRNAVTADVWWQVALP